MQNNIEKAKKVKSKYQEEWLSYGSIVSIGIGHIENDKVGIIIGVNGKITSREKEIPSLIDGVPIVVKTVKELRAL